MREDIPAESIDLIYLDPPFNSKRIYNAFHGGAQWVAFDDTWRWHEAVDDFHDLCSGPGQLADTMEGLRRILGEGPNLAYLSYMANRLRECWRVLKPTGTLYLHCDPTMSHYLKIVMDGIFDNRRNKKLREQGNEIIWFYDDTPGRPQTAFARKHDVIFRYPKGKKWTFNGDAVRVPIKEASKKRYKYARTLGGRTYIGGESAVKGKIPEDVWKIPAVKKTSAQAQGYDTEKPMRLLERIISSSSNKGDVVLDPFCGCGTTIHEAHRLGRNWIGIDVCVKACQVIQRRLKTLLDVSPENVEFIGFPRTFNHARTLADMDKFRFERWAASLVDGMEANKQQRADKGIDGRGRIALRKGEFVDIVSQVKGGTTGPGDVQAFNGARQQAGAEIGFFICFEGKVTPRMREAAACAGRFMDVPVIQIYTVEDFFEGRQPELPLPKVA